MSDCIPQSELALVLKKAETYASPLREETLLSVLGVGCYENPLSDLLAFFLKPDAAHGLDLLFLKCLLSCINADVCLTDAQGISVMREARTSDAKRPDFIIQGPSWVLLVEHKVLHGQNNPFSSYEMLAEELSNGGQRQKLFAILSPSGTSERPGWTPVSHADFTRSLRQALEEYLQSASASKWTLLSEDLISHIETHVQHRNQIMTEEEACFVEQHQSAIDQVERMAYKYRSFLEEDVRRSLSEAYPEIKFETKGEPWGGNSWAIRAYARSRWNQCNVVFWNSRTPGDSGFYVSIYVNERHAEAGSAFCDLYTWPEGKWRGFRILSPLPDRAEGLKELVKQAGVLNTLFPSEPPPPAVDNARD